MQIKKLNKSQRKPFNLIIRSPFYWLIHLLVLIKFDCCCMSKSLKQIHSEEVWTKASIHYQASKVGYPKGPDYKVCECCDHPIEKTQIPFDQHTKEFQIFGFGYPLYFSYLKYCIILVFVLVASKTSASLYMATKENYDFCYGSGHLNVAEDDLHHFRKVQETGAEHLNLRHFAGNHLDLKSDHHSIQSMNQSYNRDKVHLGQAKPHSPKTDKDAPKSGHPEPSKDDHPKPAKDDHPKPTNDGHPKPAKDGHPKPAKDGHPKPGHPKLDSQDPQSHHHNAHCTSFMVYFSVFIGQDQYQNYFLRIISFLVHLVALIGIRNMLIKQEQYYDERTCSLSDYSILVSGVPQIYRTGEYVLKIFEEEFKKKKQVKELIYIFEDENIEKYEKAIRGLQEKKLKAIEKDDQTELDEIENKIHETQQHAKAEIKTLKGDIKRDYIKCQKIIIIMNTENDKGDVLKQFSQNKRDYTHYFYPDSNEQSASQVELKLKEAPEPNEIIWEHIDESDVHRKRYICLGWTLTLLFLAAVTVVFFFIMLAKTNLFVSALELEQHEPDNPKAQSIHNFATFVVFIALFGVILFNKFVMGKVLHIFVHMEKHAYTDSQGHSFAMKYALGMFFTTALMTLAVEALYFKNFYQHPYGVIEEETIMFFVTAFFIPFVWLIHPYNLYKKFQLWLSRGSLVTQEKANELVEDFAYDLGKRYAQIFEIMWFTFLYCELIPLGSFLILIGLSLYYWVDKYNFLRRSAVKEGLSGKITILSLKSMDATLFLAPAGRVLFCLIIHKYLDFLGIFLTILGLIYICLPMTEIIEHYNSEKFKLADKTYDQAKQSFKEHYVTLHPVYKLTHKSEIAQFRKKVVNYYKNKMNNPEMFADGRKHFSTVKSAQKK